MNTQLIKQNLQCVQMIEFDIINNHSSFIVFTEFQMINESGTIFIFLDKSANLRAKSSPRLLHPFSFLQFIYSPGCQPPESSDIISPSYQSDLLLFFLSLSLFFVQKDPSSVAPLKAHPSWAHFHFKFSAASTTTIFHIEFSFLFPPS